MVTIQLMGADGRLAAPFTFATLDDAMADIRIHARARGRCGDVILVDFPLPASHPNVIAWVADDCYPYLEIALAETEGK